VVGLDWRVFAEQRSLWLVPDGALTDKKTQKKQQPTPSKQ
jgi:hypothetical protein